MSNSSQKPRQAPTIPALHNAAYLASLAGTKSLTPASKYVRPYDLAKFIADALMEIEDPASATLVLRNQHARVTRTHNGVLAGKITRGEMVAFDDCRAETRACGLGTVINRSDAVAYAEMIGIAFGVGGNREQVAAATAPVVAQANHLKPVQRGMAQNEVILAEIRKQGFDPLALPKNETGKNGTKYAIRLALDGRGLFVGKTVFNKAWERLTSNAEIVIRG